MILADKPISFFRSVYLDYDLGYREIKRGFFYEQYDNLN